MSTISEICIDIFDLCVNLLYMGADITGMTYKEINVLIFVILHPLVTIYFMFKYFRLRYGQFGKRG